MIKRILETKEILAKGPDMRISELKQLINMGVEKREIAKALGMSPSSRTFLSLLADIGAVRAQIKMTKEEYIGLRKQGLSLEEIAEIKKVSVKGLKNWKSRHGIRDKDLIRQGILPETCLARGRKNEAAQKG